MKFLDDFSGEATTLSLLLALVVAAVGVWRWAKTRNHIPKVELTNPPPTLPFNGIHMGLDDFTALQRKLRDEARADLAAAHGEERKRLEDKIDALNARLADPDRALAEQQAIITSLEDQLTRRGNQLGGDAVTAAKAALEAGDFTKASALFETLAADTAPDVQAHAEASFALGLIAEQDIRWHDAANHFARAAKLNPTFDTLQNARLYAWRAGNYPAAFGFGAELLEWAKAKGTQEQLATALNEHAVTLQAQGQYAQAEALCRQALKIDRATIGEAHPNYAIRLNNLAGVVQAQGRLAEAEGLFRQALEIGRATIGEAHPNYATRLNNLAGVVRAQGRLAEAEALYRQALEIGRATIGEAHPDYATHLNNLASVLQAQGRLAEAEGLFRQALEIDRATIGEAHPGYATDLSNLGGVLLKQGKLDAAQDHALAALAILRTGLGDGHPDTQQSIRNVLFVLTTHFPDDPQIADLQALLVPRP